MDHEVPKSGSESMVSGMSEAGRSMRRDFPLLWKMAGEFDFAERLGGCKSELHAEADAAMREIWSARQFLAYPYRPGQTRR